MNNSFKITLEDLYKNGYLSRIVIDEVHCLSLWGHEFRPSYLQLYKLRDKFPEVPFMGLTASATPKVESDVKTLLKFNDSETQISDENSDNCKTYSDSFYRSNLKIEIRRIVNDNPFRKNDGFYEILNLLNYEYKNKCGIVYCHTRKGCEKLQNKLSECGINSEFYHAGLDSNERDDIQKRWSNNKTLIVIATIAFGMGIDKPDVRFVFHCNIPRNLESYYQEIGRAGRDGKDSKCILFYNYSDKQMLERLIYNQPDMSTEMKHNQISKLYQNINY